MSAPPVHVRDATAAVAALLTELGHPTRAADVPARLDAIRAERGLALLAVDDDGRAFCFLSAAHHAVVHAAGPVALITALVVTAAARGRGVGRALVAAAPDWARRAGCVRITVTSGEHRADAHAFYPACGMPDTGRRFAATLDPTPHR